jgi:voltage-gated potassium channel
MMSPRRRLFAILEEGDDRRGAGRVCDIFLIALISANAAAVILESVPEIALSQATGFRVFEAVSVAIFTVEYVLRVWAAPENPAWSVRGARYARLRHIISPLGVIDLIAILPFYLSMFFGVDLRIFRLLRALRILKLTRYSRALGIMATVIRKESRVIVGALAILLVVLILSAALIHFLEAAAQPEKFGTIPHAMWWAIETLTTVGYGDAIPQTLMGRVVGAFVMLLGIGVFVMWTSVFAVGFLEETRNQSFVVTWQLVARVPVFKDLDAVRIAEIAELLMPETLPPRFTVMRRGETANSMYFIASGDVEVEHPGRTFDLGPGHFFGALALLDETHRQATVTTLSDCHLLRLDGADFRELMESEPKIKDEILRVTRERRRLGLAPLDQDMDE